MFHSYANVWEEGLPIGNGKLGAMLYGTPEKAIFQCNEDSLWYGGARNRNNKACKESLSEIQTLIFKGKIKAAEQLMQESMTAMPEHQRHFEPAGDIFLYNQQHGKIQSYYRELNIEDAYVTEKYNIGENHYKINAFASYPRNIMCYRVLCQESEQSRYRVHINRARGLYTSYITGENSVGIIGATGDEGVSYCQLVKARTDGKTTQKGQYLIIENFSYLELYTTIATNFREDNPQEYCLEKLRDIEQLSWKDLKEEHIQDYHALYNNVDFQLAGSREENVDQLLESVKGTVNPYLFEMMFQFGRYLLISSSRPGSLPANLQGVWNDKLQPSWDSKYTININTEMNYWIAEKAGLSQCHIPLFDHLQRMYPNGKRTAKEMYDLDGFVAHHNTDIWGDTAPQDMYMPASYWPMGGAWLSLNIWEHYSYTKDQKFLDKYFYILEDALRFLLNYVVELPNGDFVTNPSVSPENKYYTKEGEVGYMSFGCTMDIQIIWELIQDYLQGTNFTKFDPVVAEKAKIILEKLPSHKIGKHNQLMEWYEDYDECDLGHRHISHLFGLFPGHRLKTETPQILSAAKVSIERRLANGGGHTGWSVAWLLNLWANFHEGQECYQMMLKQLKNSTLPNLLDNHPPFQIDGNFGFTSGVIEMLIQFYKNELWILPALCTEWKTGSIKGICLPNKVKIDIFWQDSKLSKLVINGNFDGDVNLYVGTEKLGKLSKVNDSRILWYKKI